MYTASTNTTTTAARPPEPCEMGTTYGTGVTGDRGHPSHGSVDRPTSSPKSRSSLAVFLPSDVMRVIYQRVMILLKLLTAATHFRDDDCDESFRMFGLPNVNNSGWVLDRVQAVTDHRRVLSGSPYPQSPVQSHFPRSLGAGGRLAGRSRKM